MHKTSIYRKNEGRVLAIAGSGVANRRQIYRNIPGLIAKARKLMSQFPGDAWVPHMRSVENYPSDSKAIEEPASEEEKRVARDYINSRNLEVEIVDIVELEIFDAVAFHDREKSGKIFVSTDLASALERIQDDNEAVSAAGIILGHEQGHDAWYENRGQHTKFSPDSFKGVTTKSSEAVEKVSVVGCVEVERPL